MNASNSNADPVQLRLWPAVLIVVGQLVVQSTGYPFGPEKTLHGWVLLLVWWLCFSAVPVRQRIQGVLLFAGIGVVLRLLMHPSMDFVIFFYVVPTVTALMVFAWLVARLEWRHRRWIGFWTGIVGLLVWTLVRVEGVSGDLVPTFRYRWQRTPEQIFLAAKPIGTLEDANVLPNDGASDNEIDAHVDPQIVIPTAADWPSFRGAQRNANVNSQQLGECDVRLWGSSQPRELWRRPVGPAWSSFAVVGDRLFTNEQRGEDECVVCYDASTGDELWQHASRVRFDEMLAGVGPRATPCVDADGFVYSIGATGEFHCLRVIDGSSVWSLDLKQDLLGNVPHWGFSSSPLVVDEMVYVLAGTSSDAPTESSGEARGEATEGSLVAIQKQDGTVIWRAGAGSGSYSSPQLVTLGNTQQILNLTGWGLESMLPATGELIWSFEWPAGDDQEARIIQPVLLADDQILIGSESESICLRVWVEDDQWQVAQSWSSREIKPDFNDWVQWNECVFGFDGSILSCIDATDGSRHWRKRGYGKGQLLLLVDDGLLLVLTESGEVAIVEAAPTFTELCRFDALRGKTWNHPVVAGGRLYLRNSSEAVCYELNSSSK